MTSSTTAFGAPAFNLGPRSLNVCRAGGPGQDFPFFWQFKQVGQVSSHLIFRFRQMKHPVLFGTPTILGWQRTYWKVVLRKIDDVVYVGPKLWKQTHKKEPTSKPLFFPVHQLPSNILLYVAVCEVCRIPACATLLG